MFSNKNGGDIYKGFPLVKGLDFHVESPTEFVLKQELPSADGSAAVYCQSRVQWKFCICKGCKCKEQVSISIVHDMEHVKGANAGIAKCSKWYGYADQAIRTYTASVRASLLSHKVSCCTPWAHAHNAYNMKLSGKDTCLPPTCTGCKASAAQHKSLRGSPVWTRSQGHGRHCTHIICNDEKFSGATVANAKAIKKAYWDTKGKEEAAKKKKARPEREAKATERKVKAPELRAKRKQKQQRAKEKKSKFLRACRRRVHIPKYRRRRGFREYVPPKGPGGVKCPSWG